MKTKSFRILFLCLLLIVSLAANSFSEQWTLVEGDTENLDMLCYSNYLDGNSVILLSDHLQKTWDTDFTSINNIILKNSNFYDLAIELVSQGKWVFASKEGEFSFKVNPQDKYQLWMKKSKQFVKFEINQDQFLIIKPMLDHPQDNLAYRKIAEFDPINFKTKKQSVYFKEIKLKKEIIQKKPTEYSFVLVKESDLLRVQELLKKKIIKDKTPVGYLITEDTKIYVP